MINRTGEMMDYSFLYRQLELNAVRIATLARGVTADEAHWKPNPTSWSILEVINHLYDEEREDFRVRLDIILNNPDQPFPPIDPEGWVVARKYNERDLAQSLENFLDERRHSLTWLNTLLQPAWQREYRAPFGIIQAGDIFGAWVTHDQLHMRQLVEIQRALVAGRTQPYELNYAGEW